METELDRMHARMIAYEDDLTARLGFFGCLADSELFLLLSEEPKEQKIAPQVFDLDDGPCILVFDLEERLVDFLGSPAPYAALSGRAIAEMIAGQGIGLGLNLGVASSEILLPAAAVEWMGDVVSQAPQASAIGKPEFTSPGEVADDLIEALRIRLNASSGLGREAWLLRDRSDLLLLVSDAPPLAQQGLAKSLGEAAGFAGARALDVGFIESGSDIALQAASIGMRFDIPEPRVQEKPKPAAPGSDPNTPPRLR